MFFFLMVGFVLEVVDGKREMEQRREGRLGQETTQKRKEVKEGGSGQDQNKRTVRVECP